jgi:hypothetical protein
MMATGDNLKNTKAVLAAVLGFFGPGLAVLVPEVAPGGDGIQGRELLWAGLLSLAFAAGGGIAVQRVENKPKDVS